MGNGTNEHEENKLSESLEPQAIIGSGQLAEQDQTLLPKRRGRAKGSKNKVNERMLSTALQRRLKSRKLAADVADVVINKALEGNLTAIDMIWTRAEGKPKQGIGNDQGLPFQIQVVR
jgi:hypothetical protein